jgi:hypothetical protein
VSLPKNDELTMHDYLDNHLPETWEILLHDGTYAEIKADDGLSYEVHASGNGDFKSHKIEFKEL